MEWWRRLKDGRGSILEHELHHTVASVWVKEEIVSCSDDAVQFIGHILKCISLNG